ncbi:hypothetical protein KK083_08650 [Fulvivirgaceae bacterium PWU4]|uniref:Uncharacterized protein n=1 Tax=Chryseosolibacter histidini TaxID=2782349 RepID=A0AAP2GIC2_9BACT|nr:hypothetical protein [Chryseosolibacter histidini]MBT1696939.1 hypothetical protein [Chryseosolibacter histidini]
MLRQFKDLIFDIPLIENRVKFPLKKNAYGFYDAHYTRGHDLRCPNCGSTIWSIKSYQHLECATCYKNFSNLGVLGMQEIPAQEWQG